MERKAPDQEVVTTVIRAASSNVLSGKNISRELEKHRGYAQHHVMVMCNQSVAAGVWDVFFLPDSTEIDARLSVDTGENLSIASGTQGSVMFTGFIRGIVLKESTGPTADRDLTFLITSSKGQLINS